MNHTNLKAILSLMILCLAFGIFGIFNTYKENLAYANNDTFHLFMSLTVVGMGLLLTLLYLVNQSTSKHAAKSSHAPKKKKKSSR